MSQHLSIKEEAATCLSELYKATAEEFRDAIVCECWRPEQIEAANQAYDARIKKMRELIEATSGWA
jgi:hypothetical protein